MTEKKIYNLFPDTIFQYKLENYEKINKELLDYILDLQKKDSIGNNRSNRGGWHSPNFDNPIGKWGVGILFFGNSGSEEIHLNSEASRRKR